MNKITLIILLSSLGFILFFTESCCTAQEQEPLKIAISKDLPPKYITTYSAWINRHESNVEFYNLYPMGLDSAMEVLKKCDGLLLTGGRDVFPAYYDNIDDTARCGSFDTYRDSLEFAAIEEALILKMPIVGICRGEQILNVSQGGSLYIDIPTDFDTSRIHRQKDWRNCYHDVFIVNTTSMATISGVQYGKVNSNHHQGIEILGKGLKISAYSADSLPEAIEWENRGEKGFLMAVQWHPERMDTLHLLSAPIAKEFLKEAMLFNGKE